MVEYREPESRKGVSTQHLLIQENLFYGKNVARMCDLKGALLPIVPHYCGEQLHLFFSTVLPRHLPAPPATYPGSHVHPPDCSLPRPLATPAAN